MVVVDAGVDHGHLDAAAGQSKRALRDIDAGHAQRRHQIGDGARLALDLLEVDLHHRVHRPHSRERTQL